ncbi:MAG: isocitrate dehydrogenase (NADP(+)) [Bacillota bacterium]
MTASNGEKISVEQGALKVPDNVIIPYIEGDGVGPGIWAASKKVFDAAVLRRYGNSRSVVWTEVLAGEKAYEATGQWLPQSTLDTVVEHTVTIKGPLTTPVGGGFRSLNVTIRQVLDLYACIRPVRWIKGVPAPVKNPEHMNVVIFRENTEDVYAGLEWTADSKDAADIRKFLKERFGVKLTDDTAIGLKPMSKWASQRLIRKAVNYAISNDRRSVTLVHKGNIMKYTEGAFRDWGYQLAKQEFGFRTLTEEELFGEFEGKAPDGKVIIKDRIADNMLQQLLTRTRDYDILAMPNLNGDYFSDAAAAQVGGLGMAPGANIGDRIAVFEATHGTAPKYAGMDMVNPCSLILSGVMMFEYLGWGEVGDTITDAVEKTISQGVVTYDLARMLEDGHEVSTSAFAQAVVDNMD